MELKVKGLGSSGGNNTYSCKSLGPLVNRAAAASGPVEQGKTHRYITGEVRAAAVIDQGNGPGYPDYAVIQAAYCQGLVLYLKVRNEHILGRGPGIVAALAFADGIVRVDGGGEITGTAYDTGGKGEEDIPGLPRGQVNGLICKG